MRDGGAQREGAALEQRARSGVCVRLMMTRNSAAAWSRQVDDVDCCAPSDAVQ